MSHACPAPLRRARFLVFVAAVVSVVASCLGPVSSAAATTTYSAYIAYASAPREVIGKTAQGYRLVPVAEAAAVPASSITVLANTQYLQVASTGVVYKVQFESVTVVTSAQWVTAGTPTPRIVDRVPALEYCTYASAPSEVMVRTPVGSWRHATAAEVAAVPASSIVRRTGTYYIQTVGSDQIIKRVNGVSAAITDDQWRGQGSPTPMVPPLPTIGADLFATRAPYVDPTYPSVAAATALRAAGRTADAALIDKISAHGGTEWLGSTVAVAAVAGVTSQYVGAAIAAGRTGVLVVYGIPGRDCTGYSSGGFSATDYPKWIDQIAAGIAARPVTVVLEPDAVLQLGRCPAVQGDRTGMLRYAATTLTAAGASVYLDGATANSGVDTDVMAARLIAAGVLSVRGFAVNVSNYKTTSDVQGYAEALSRLLGGAHYVIDTSRNGNGSTGEWCNVPGRAIGAVPSVSGFGHEDAALWIKTIGLSDGTCNGGPAAGTWWNDIALELVRNSSL